MAEESVDAMDTPESKLQFLIGKFDPKSQLLIHSVRAALRKRFPTANELVYDYGFSLVVGYSPTENGIESIVSSSCRAEGLSLYFMHGPQLPDPKKLLMGSAKQVRFIPVESADRVEHPDVEALIVAAIGKAAVPLAATGDGKVVIKTFGPKKPAKTKAKAKTKPKAKVKTKVKAKAKAKPKAKAKAKAKPKAAKRKPARAKSKK